ncbi:Hypothetical predicted protein [Cloeon dipterum]|uniref:Bardet-Biedl syndrome 1 N-terminal domain-containing protein n=1 Tax=Cloeon dipterum TaxID=197152 RepID=A0A8S1DLP7_9INSE|nr:Hypothetical predicted protein [Cloeon dipterum]
MAKNWLEAHADFSAGVHTFGQCMALADLNADGDHRLIIADHGQFLANRSQAKLKVYRGTSLIAENAILDLPVAIAAFHMDTTQPRIPAIAVASGPHIYIYKNMRPYFKFSLPPMDVSSVERDVWAQAKEGNIEVDILTDMLSGLSKEVGFSRLTARSQHLLSLPEAALRRKFVEEQKSQPLKRQTTITCLTTLKKALPDEDAVTCLVVGTESGHVYILDSEAFTILDTVQVSGVPCFMGAVGLRDVEFRIVVACRNRQLLQIKRGWREARPLAQPPAQTLGLAIGPNAVVLALMDDTLRWYSKKGKEAWSFL